MPKLSQEQFNEKLQKFNLIALEDYKDSRLEIKLKCLNCGTEFVAKPLNFIYKENKKVCPNCKDKKVSDTSSFIEKAQKIHKNYYDYSKVNYINSKTKVCIICPEHGEFWQKPNTHLSGKGCPKCGKIKTTKAHTLTKEEFINKANIIYNNKYNYSNVDYINNHTKVCIICPQHGEFWQEPRTHLEGHGCPKCAFNIPSTIEFIEKSNVIHNNKYNYSKVDYINAKTKVVITCPIHGDFEQTPDHHLRGQGCPICKASKGEIEINKILTKYNIKFLQEHILKHTINNRLVRVDFILEYNKQIYIIEYNGIQHYMPVDYFGGQKAFELQVIRDQGLRNLCKEYCVNLIEIPYTLPLENIEKELIKELNINNYEKD